MPLVLTDFTAAMTTYIQAMNGNNTLIEDAVNSLQASVSALGGDGSDLIFDLWDRGGIVGPHSYQLDLLAYAGGASIDIGRRPAPVAPETDKSIAAFTIGGIYQRVDITGDTTLSAAGIVAGLPKTIYVGVASSGVPVFFENTLTTNTLYVWSMTWDGVNLTAFQRIAPILPHYTLVQAVAGQPQMIEADDWQTNFVDDADSVSYVTLPGGAAANGFAALGFEVLGFFATVPDEAEDGFTSPVNGTTAEEKVSLDVYVGATKWSAVPIDIDTDALPQTKFVGVLAGIGTAKFVFTTTRFRLKRVSVGTFVTSASGLKWGVMVRPIYGATEAARSATPGLV